MLRLIKIGSIQKTKGLTGFISLFFEEPLEYKDLKVVDFLFINIDGSKVPFKIEKINVDKGSIGLEDINSPEMVREHLGREVYLMDEDFQKFTPHDQNQDQLIGMQIWDKSLGFIGTIEDYIALPMQITLIVVKDEKSWKIPFHEDLVDTFDESKKIITLNLPEGILDLT